MVRVVDHYHCSNPECDYEYRNSYPEGTVSTLTNYNCPKCNSEVIFNADNGDRAMLVGFEAIDPYGQAKPWMKVV